MISQVGFISEHNLADEKLIIPFVGRISAVGLCLDYRYGKSYLDKIS